MKDEIKINTQHNTSSPPVVVSFRTSLWESFHVHSTTIIISMFLELKFMGDNPRQKYDVNLRKFAFHLHIFRMEFWKRTASLKNYCFPHVYWTWYEYIMTFKF